jgi:hypothetical protein
MHIQSEINFIFQPRCKFHKVVIAHCLELMSGNPGVESIEIKGLKLFADDLHVFESKADVFKKRMAGGSVKRIRIWDQFKSQSIDLLL